MKLSWNNLKISIAGARLSHLVQRDAIWDHGSMIEQVRTAFVYLKKAFLRNDPSFVKKCMTSDGYLKIKNDIGINKTNMIINTELTLVEIIAVTPARNHHPDKFRALIKLKKSQEAGQTEPLSFYRSNRLIEEEWLFVREGSWWLLHEMKA